VTLIRTHIGMRVRRGQCAAAGNADGRAGARRSLAAARRGGPGAAPRHLVMTLSRPVGHDAVVGAAGAAGAGAVAAQITPSEQNAKPSHFLPPIICDHCRHLLPKPIAYSPVMSEALCAATGTSAVSNIGAEHIIRPYLRNVHRSWYQLE